IRSVLGSINLSLSVQDLEAIPSAPLQLLYNVKLSEGPNLLLALPPPAVMRLLRSERSSIGSEAAILRWLSKKISLGHLQSGNDTSKRQAPNIQRVANSLSTYLPILLKHELIDGGLAVEYNLSRPPQGMTISSLSRPLNRRERRSVDFQTGQLVRLISSQLSPTQRFGMAADVLSVPDSISQACRVEGSLHDSRGADCWSAAFHSLLESILRDGEDLSIMINYGAIRRHFNHFKHLLNAVTKSRLVVLDAGEDTNLLVFRLSEMGKKANPVSGRTIQKRQGVTTSAGSSSWVQEGSYGPVDYMQHEDQIDSEDGADIQTDGQIEVTGLRQWTNCLFGDPLISSVFSKHPGGDFWNGFDQAFSGATDAEEDVSPNIVEDEPNAHIRMLLYECYHAVVAVVREFYRPRSDSDRREFTARKKLSSVLARLDELNEDDSPRRRRPSGEVSPAKKSRPGEDDD
ncbi:hypothetical protein BGZ63DRAFT_329565, partial [Mariannaea sp. PMI_226]